MVDKAHKHNTWTARVKASQKLDLMTQLFLAGQASAGFLDDE
jgi:hypothetical protein